MVVPVTGSHSRPGPTVLAVARRVSSGDQVIPVAARVGGLRRAAELVLGCAHGPVGHCWRWRLIGTGSIEAILERFID